MDNITFKGFNKLARQLVRLGFQAKTELASALLEEGEKIMADAKENYVPVDLGTLKSTGFVEQQNDTTIVLGFGGPAAPYAISVHENMQAYHKVGSAKYLEIPYNKARSGLSGRLYLKLKSRK